MTRDEVKERDTLFCEILFEVGSIAEASKQLGIPVRTGRKIANRNQQAILDMTNSELASLSYKAVKAVKDVLQDDDGLIVKADTKLKAATEILDRVGAAKRTVSEVEVKAERPIILMPQKDTVCTQPLIVNTTEE